jgi:hypothetical protein
MLGFGFPKYSKYGEESEPSNWILATNNWADAGVWIDAETWND